MKSMEYLKAAAAALALLGAAALATPSDAAVLTASTKATLVNVANGPTANEQAIIKLLEQVTPGSTQTLATMIKTSPDVATLAASVEAYTALNPSLMAVIENAVAAFAADPRLAPIVAATDCSADVASIHSLVRIWCGLPPLDPYPVMPDLPPAP
jgi:hypothetical protein